MAITILQAPDAFALTRAGRMMYVFSGNGRVVTAGAKAVNEIAFTNCTEGTKVVLAWNGRTFTYTARTAPTNDMEFPTGNGSAAYVDSLLSFFNGRYEIREDFVVTRAQIGSPALLQTILLTAKTTGPNYNLTAYVGITNNFSTGITAQAKTPGVLADTRSQYGVHAEIWLERADGSTFDRVYANTIEADDTGLATLDVGSILHPEFAIDFPGLAADAQGLNYNANPGTSRRFFVVYGEAYGQPQQIGKLLTENTLRAYYGGADYINRAGAGFSLPDFVKQATPADDRALRFGPLSRYVLPDEPQFLSFLNVRASVANVSVEVRATYDDETVVVTNTLLPVDAYAQGRKLTVGVGPQQLALAIQNGTATLREYTIRLHVAGGSVYYSTGYRYILNYAYQRYTRYFAYLTSLGCVDTLATFGKGSAELQRFFEQAEQYLPANYALADGQFVDYDVSLQQQIEVTTGYRDQAELLRWNDFYRSPRRLIIDRQRGLPISIVSKSIKQQKDGDNQFAHKFEYVYAYRDDFFTGTQDNEGDPNPPQGYQPAGTVVLTPAPVVTPVVDPTIPPEVRQLTVQSINQFKQAVAWGNHADAGYIDQQQATSLFAPVSIYQQLQDLPDGAGVLLLAYDTDMHSLRVAAPEEIRQFAITNSSLSIDRLFLNSPDPMTPEDFAFDVVIRSSNDAQLKLLSTEDFISRIDLPAGPKGDQGDTGGVGPVGPIGPAGRDGTTGTEWFFANVDPSTIGGTIGKIKDYWLNESTGDLFRRISDLPNNAPATWLKVRNLTGPRGLTGPIGPAGPAGSGGPGTGGPALVYMVPDTTGLEDFPQPGPGHEYDVAGWQVIFNLAHAAFMADDALTARANNVELAVVGKVDKVTGKGLSTNDYTTAEKNKLAALPVAGQKGDKGDAGAPGPKGDKGDKGDPGAPGSGGSGYPAISATVIDGNAYQYAPILGMPRSGGDTYDDSVLEVGLDLWESNTKKTYYLNCSNRGGFQARNWCEGDSSVGGQLVAYRQNNPDGSELRTTLFVRSALGFNECSCSFQSIVGTTPAGAMVFSPAVPTGTLVYDSAVTKPDFEVGAGSFLRKVRQQNTADFIPGLTMGGELVKLSLDKTLRLLINEASDATIQALCARLSAIGCGSTAPVVTPVGDPVFSFGPHFQSVALPTSTPAPLAHDYVVMVGENNCDLVTGAIVDRNYPNVPASVDIFINHALLATITATNTRSDLAGQYGGNASSLYGFVWQKPASLKNGQAHILNVFAANTATEATYASPQTTPVCAAPAQTPTVIQYVLSGPVSLGENSTIHVYLTQRLSDGTTQRYTGPVTAWTIAGGTPTGITLTPTNSTAELDIAMTAIPAGVSSIVLRATIGNGLIEESIGLVATACHRPAAGLLNVYLAWNYSLSNGDVKTFDTLDNAGNIMGRIFNEANIGITGFSKFKAQMANYNIGTDVFLNWSGDGDTSCTHVSDRIYYVLDGNGNDSQKQEVYVVNGKIADVKPSTYAVPATPAAATTVARIYYSQFGTGDNNQLISILLSRAAERVQIRLRNRYTSGQIGEYSDWFLINQGNSASGYITSTRNPDYSLEMDVRPVTNTGAAIAHILIPNAAGDVPDTQLYPA